MGKRWYEKPMRIAALQCNYENGENLRVIDKWLDMGFNVEQLFHPMADKYSALFDKEEHGAILREYTQKAQKEGLRIILYLNIHILGPSLSEYREEWGQRDPEGGFPLLYETYPAVCLNSPYRDYFYRVLRNLEEYKIDGVFLDGPVIVSGGCWCDHCQKQFSKEYGKPLAESSGDERYTFYRDTRDRFLREGYQIFKSIKPEGIYYINLPVSHAHGSYVDIPLALEYNDLVGSEGGFQFYGPPQDAPLFRPGITARLLEAVAPNKPRVIFMAGDQKPWSWYVHTPRETKLCIADSTANGASIWWGIHGSTRLLETPGGRSAREMLRFLAENSKEMDHGSSLAQTAVLYSYDTAASYRTTQEATDFYGSSGEKESCWGDFARAFNGVCSTLASRGIPFDVITDLPEGLDRWMNYKVVLLPTCASLSPGAVDMCRQFTREGGTLIALFDTSLFDEKGRKLENFQLSDLLGVSARGYTHYRNFNYMTVNRESGLCSPFDLPYIPAPEYGVNVEAAPETRVHTQFLGALEGRYMDLKDPAWPAITENSYGKGRSFYWAGTVGEMIDSYNPPEYGEILARMIQKGCLPLFELESNGTNIEMTVRGQEKQIAVHLVNAGGLVNRPFTAVMPATYGSVRVNPDLLPDGYALDPEGDVRALRARKNLGVRREKKNGREVLEIELPRIEDYEVIILPCL